MSFIIPLGKVYIKLKFSKYRVIRKADHHIQRPTEQSRKVIKIRKFQDFKTGDAKVIGH